MQQRKNIRVAPLVLAIMALVGCGGGSSSNNPQTTTVSGKVMDGYIANATVCLDLNTNYRCDASEPSTTSDTNGNYTLIFNGSASNRIILAEAFADAKDADDGGMTLNEAGRYGFTLAAPAVQASVISPLTTLVTLDLLTNINAPITDASIAVSVKNVQTALDNSDPIMGSDYVKTNNVKLRQLATVTTAALAETYMKADTAVRGAVSETLNDPQLIRQTAYKAFRDGLYASLGFVLDFKSSNPLKYPLAAARTNVVIATDFLKVTGTGATATLAFVMPDRETYLNNLTFHDSACPSTLTDLECFVRQEFVQ